MFITSLLCAGIIASTTAGDIVEDNNTDYDLTGDDETVLDEESPRYSVCELCRCVEPDNLPLHLDCANINLTSIPNIIEDVSGNVSMTLDLSYNLIHNISSLPGLDVWELDLSHNKITNIDKYVFAALSHSLLHLDLSDNRISAAGLSDQSLGKDMIEDDTPFVLIDLSLSNNRIHSLPPAIFSQIVNLEDLDLSFNPLGDMDDSTATAIGSLVSLHYLNLKECQLTFLPETLLSGLFQLLRLDLSGNYFTSVDPRLRMVPSLASLVLDNNHIQYLDHNSFQGLENLRNLSVSENLYFSKIEKDAFSLLLNLEELRMVKNPSLSWIHPEAWPTNEDNLEVMFNVRVFLLSQNNLRYLPSMLLPTFNNWNDIEVLDIQGNPWWCDCHNEWMITTLVKNIQAKTPELTPGITCMGPPKTPVVKEQMMIVSELSSHDLPCDTFQFDPFMKNFNIVGDRAVTPDMVTTVHGLAAGVVVTCVMAIIATAALVFTLHRQQQNKRRLSAMRFASGGSTPQVGYMPAPKQGVVRTSFGVGYFNQEFKDEEAEMKEIRSVQGWPPVTKDKVAE